LDVREPDEIAYASIDGARSIPLRELPGRIIELGLFKDREVVVYCHHGIRSQRAAQFLVQAGFSRVFNLTGGIDRWSLEVDSNVRRY
jgi:rhodanese-related sulfurtransferase